jgi:hypothetical protein
MMARTQTLQVMVFISNFVDVSEHLELGFLSSLTYRRSRNSIEIHSILGDGKAGKASTAAHQRARWVRANIQ